MKITKNKEVQLATSRELHPKITSCFSRRPRIKHHQSGEGKFLWEDVLLLETPQMNGSCHFHQQQGKLSLQ